MPEHAPKPSDPDPTQPNTMGDVPRDSLIDEDVIEARLRAPTYPQGDRPSEATVRLNEWLHGEGKREELDDKQITALYRESMREDGGIGHTPHHSEIMLGKLYGRDFGPEEKPLPQETYYERYERFEREARERAEAREALQRERLSRRTERAGKKPRTRSGEAESSQEAIDPKYQPFLDWDNVVALDLLISDEIRNRAHLEKEARGIPKLDKPEWEQLRDGTREEVIEQYISSFENHLGGEEIPPEVYSYFRDLLQQARDIREGKAES